MESGDHEFFFFNNMKPIRLKRDSHGGAVVPVTPSHMNIFIIRAAKEEATGSGFRAFRIIRKHLVDIYYANADPKFWQASWLIYRFGQS